MNNIPKIIHWWVTPKLPREHIFISPEKRPKEINKIIRVYFRKWVVHPLKRRFARYYLKFLQAFFGLTVIGITGSAGKTTTKEMIASILSQKGKTLWTPANVDPVYNIPSTILRCTPATKYLILEMGVEFPGEMDFYLWLAKPQVGVTTNIYQTHTQFFKNIGGVAREKEKLVIGLGKNDVAILNKENSHLRKIAKEIKARIVWFGKSGDVRAENLVTAQNLKTKFRLLINNSMPFEVDLPLLGTQFVENALAAAAVGKACNANLTQIKKGLEDFEIPEHRMRPIKLKNGALILDDSYNSNPAAAKTALETLKEVAGKKKMVVVMGDMLELGQDEIERHKELGRAISEMETDYLVAVGLLAKNIADEAKKAKTVNVSWVKSQDDVLPILKPILTRDTVVLVKGSRSIGLDKLIDRLVR